MRINRTAAAVVGIVAMTGLSLTFATSASANTGLVYETTDSDNDEFSGIYLRNSPSMSDVDRIEARYMHYGDDFELICGVWGESVGPNDNQRWHYVYVLEGPATGQEGWIADRYATTPNAANELTPDEPACGTGSEVHEKPNGASLYFSPFDGDGPDASSPAAVTLDVDQWQPCNDAHNAVPATSQLPNEPITTLAGWSAGRIAPIMYLDAKPEGWASVNFILLIDPGSSEDYAVDSEGDCDGQYNQDQILADWLASSQENRLMVLAGSVTADYGSTVNGYAHAGIQNTIFPAIRDDTDFPKIQSQVLVCNYDNTDHTDMWMEFKNTMNSANHSDCPGIPDAEWHP
jgi:hypothetical protein